METASHNEDTRETRNRDASDERAAQMEVAALYQQGRFDQAEKALSEALAKWPESASLLTERGDLFRLLGQYDKALNAFDEALARDPGDEHTIVLKVLTLRLQERFQEAGVVLRDALAQRPQSARLLAQRDALFDDIEMKVVTLRLQKRLQEADHMLSDALTGLPLSERGALLCDLGQYDDAIKVLNEALKVDAGDQRALKLKVLTLRLQRHFDDADRVLSDALAT